ncbi:hypothetical protein [Telmatospirillum sp.]|uniref:hypothetical protein n=1 Tax=Telmatospirillum sp. TaxID=2079197 RepID=UPI00284E75B2|nr:hypothetical protein [Telmatospirillum sp.]MDR3436465.1 hypothetical protein [Telmatospirillum sp.]
MNQSDLEAAVAATPGPKVTKEGIESRIESVNYLRIGPTVTKQASSMDAWPIKKTPGVEGN